MDVFVAYSSKDESRVRTIVEWLRRNDLDVWVAYELPAGLDWDTEIDRVLAEIPCVLAVWSPDAVASAEVKGEARAAMARDALVTVSLDNTPPPRSFTHLHAVDLTDLAIGEDSPRTGQALSGIRAKLGSGAPTPVEPAVVEAVRAPEPVTGGGNRLWLGAGGLAVLAIAAFALLNGRGQATPVCDAQEAYILAGQTFSTDTSIEEDLVCITANAEVQVKNGARLEIEAGTLVVKGPARIDGRGNPGTLGKAGSNGPVHHHKPPSVAGIAVCANAPSRADYSGKDGGRGGNGGRGASISIRYRQLRGDPALLKYDISGGAGGAGGPGGRPGLATCKVIKPYNVKGTNGRKGVPGTQGEPGSFEVVQIEG